MASAPRRSVKARIRNARDRLMDDPGSSSGTRSLLRRLSLSDTISRTGRGLFRTGTSPSGGAGGAGGAGDDGRIFAHASNGRLSHLVTLVGLRPSDGGDIPCTGLPPVRVSTAGSIMLTSTFDFEPIEDARPAAFAQAGGHSGVFTPAGPVLEKKRVPEREARFYEAARAGAWPPHFLPDFHGRSADGAGIRLENLTHGFARPCVLDLKMGFVSVDASSAGLLKRVRHTLLDVVTGSSHSGVRLEGMSLHRALERRKMTSSKAHCHSMNLGVSLQDVLTFFLLDESGVRTDVALRFQAHIETLLLHFRRQRSFLFIGSSILLIYDNDNCKPHMRWARALQRLHTVAPIAPLSPDTLSALTRRTPVDVRMIDFAHTGPNPNGEEVDEGYIKGLQTILTALKAIRERRKSSIFSMVHAAGDALEAQARVASGEGSGEPPDSDSAFNFETLYQRSTAVPLEDGEGFVSTADSEDRRE